MSRVLSLTLVVFVASCGGDRTRLSDAAPQLPTAPTAPEPVPIPGAAYELIFAADGSCGSLPAETLRRRYVGRFTDSPVAYLYGGRFLGGATYASWNVVYVGATEQSLWFQDPPLWESLSDDSYLVIYGNAVGALRSGEATPFWGRFEYCADREPDAYPRCATEVVTCTSSNHRLTVQLR